MHFLPRTQEWMTNNRHFSFQNKIYYVNKGTIIAYSKNNLSLLTLVVCAARILSASFTIAGKSGSVWPTFINKKNHFQISKFTKVHY